VPGFEDNDIALEIAEELLVPASIVLDGNGIMRQPGKFELFNPGIGFRRIWQAFGVILRCNCNRIPEAGETVGEDSRGLGNAIGVRMIGKRGD
jgi:hypothetical protein